MAQSVPVNLIGYLGRFLGVFMTKILGKSF